MALSIPPTALGTFESAINHGTGAFSNSITTVNNSFVVVLLIASLTTATATDFENNLTVSGGSLTWTRRANNRATYEATFTYGAQIWTAPVVTGATFSLAIDAGALESYIYKAYVLSYTGHDTSSPVGATAEGSETPPSGAVDATLNATPASTSDVVAMVAALSDGTGVINVGSGWTELIEPAYVTDSFSEWQVQRRSGSTSTSVQWASITGTVDAAHLVAVEVKEAAGGGGAAVRPTGSGLTESRLLQRARLFKAVPSMVGWRARRGLLVPERRLAA